MATFVGGATRASFGRSRRRWLGLLPSPRLSRALRFFGSPEESLDVALLAAEASPCVSVCFCLLALLRLLLDAAPAARRACCASSPKSFHSVWE